MSKWEKYHLVFMDETPFVEGLDVWCVARVESFTALIAAVASDQVATFLYNCICHKGHSSISTKEVGCCFLGGCKKQLCTCAGPFLLCMAFWIASLLLYISLRICYCFFVMLFCLCLHLLMYVSFLLFCLLVCLCVFWRVAGCVCSCVNVAGFQFCSMLLCFSLYMYIL